MRRALYAAGALALAVAACGGGDDGHDHDHDAPDAARVDAAPTAPDADPTAPDAPAPPDGAPSSVVAVDCASVTPDATVTTSGFMYSPQATTIAVGQVVRFDPTTGHDVSSDDGLFSVPTAGEGCFRFTEAGTFPFRCTPHQFTGTITVE